MRKVLVAEFITLDGVMEAPHEWSFPFWTDEIGKFKLDELFASDTPLLGRVTYEGFAAAWPSRTDEEGFADKINGMKKVVVSTTLKTAEWNNSLILSQNVAEEIYKLKQSPGKNILLNGSSKLIETLRQHDLIDEYWLLTFPIVQGKGKRLFAEGFGSKLRLLETRSYSSGVVLLAYQSAAKQEDKQIA